MSPRFPKTPLGRVGGSNHAHVTATTPTPPIAHNAPHTKGCGIHPTELDIKLSVGRASCPPTLGTRHPPAAGIAAAFRPGHEGNSPRNVRKGECRGAKPLCRGSRGVPLIFHNIPRAGGWEEERPCSGHYADAAHRAQRPPKKAEGFIPQTVYSIHRRAGILPAGLPQPSGWGIGPPTRPPRPSTPVL